MGPVELPLNIQFLLLFELIMNEEHPNPGDNEMADPGKEFLIGPRRRAHEL